MRARGALPLAALLFSPLGGGCVTIALGTGPAVPPSGAKDAVVPTFTFAAGVAMDLPHDVRPSDPEAPRTVRIALQLGPVLTGVRSRQGAVNATGGPVVLRTDVTFARLGRNDELLLRATAQVAGPGVSVDRDPVGALGTFEVPRSSAWSVFGGGTFEIVTTHRASFLLSLGLGVHTFAGDRIETTTLLGPEVHVALDTDLLQLFGGRGE